MPSTWAQGETTSAILGQVTDSTQRGRPGATVTIINRDTGLKRTAKTDDAGPLQFPATPAWRPTWSGRRRRASRPHRPSNVFAGLGQKQTVNLTLRVAAIQADSGRECGSADHQHRVTPTPSTTLNAPALENLPNPGGDLTYPLQFAAGSADQHRRQRQRFRWRHERLRQRGIQRAARAFQRLHRRWTGDQRSADQPQQRTFHESGAGPELDLGGDRQHAFLFGGPGPLRRVAGQLRHQVRHQPVPRKSIRAVERRGAERRRLLYQRHVRQSEAALDRKPFRRQPRRPDHARQAVLLFRQRVGADRAADLHYRDSSDSGFPAVCAAATSVGRHRLGDGVALCPRAAAGALLPEDVFALRRHQRDAAGGARLSVQLRMARRLPAVLPTATAAPIAKAFRIPATITSRCRRRASITTSARTTPRGFAFRPIPDCKRPTPIPSIRYSTPSRRSRSILSPRDTRTSSRRIW